jgi:hypothetical protein
VSLTGQLSDDDILIDYYSQDGIHLNNYGYNILSAETRSAVLEMLE